MKRIVLCGLMILGLSACADMQPQTPTQTASAAKPKCEPSMPTGSHIVDTSCDAKSRSMNSETFGAGMRQANQGQGAGK